MMLSSWVLINGWESPGQTVLGRTGTLNSGTGAWSATEMVANKSGEDRKSWNQVLRQTGNKGFK